MRIFTLLFGLAAVPAMAQYISHGPVVGGVTDTSARMYIRTYMAQACVIELDEDSNFGSPLSFSTATLEALDSSYITDLTGLAADQLYHYRVLFGGNADTLTGSFRTFPQVGQPAHFTFVTGSCQETPNMKVFDVMPTYNPLFLMHTGDFTYPSYQQDNTYPVEWQAIELSYRRRYQEVVMKEMLRQVPIAYMPDDDDNWGSNRDYTYSTGYYTHPTTGKPVNYFSFDTISPIGRENCLRGYRTFFPGYPTADTTEGHYHSFKVGNCEFFVVDVRSVSDVPSDAYVYDSVANYWSFQPQAQHSILGDNQMNWLLNGLSQSTAHWKFIVSGVPFNPNIRRLIDVGLTLQETPFSISGQSGTGFRLSTSFAGYWAGYPDDIQQVLDHIAGNNIERVLVVSGDTHHNVMDDGTNARLPELNASGLSVTSTELAYTIDLYSLILGQPSVKDSLWNAGGNGLYNMNFLNAFGKVEVFGTDSVELCVIDENNVELSCFTLYSDGSVNNPWLNYTPVRFTPNKVRGFELVPNPNDGHCTAQLTGLVAGNKHTLLVSDVAGRTLHQITFVPLQTEHSIQLDLPQLSSGNYLISVQNEKEIVARQWWSVRK